jgi:hypothetical protein
MAGLGVAGETMAGGGPGRNAPASDKPRAAALAATRTAKATTAARSRASPLPGWGRLSASGGGRRPVAGAGVQAVPGRECPCPVLQGVVDDPADEPEGAGHAVEVDEEGGPTEARLVEDLGDGPGDEHRAGLAAPGRPRHLGLRARFGTRRATRLVGLVAGWYGAGHGASGGGVYGASAGSGRSRPSGPSLCAWRRSALLPAAGAGNPGALEPTPSAPNRDHDACPSWRARVIGPCCGFGSPALCLSEAARQEASVVTDPSAVGPAGIEPATQGL